MKFYEVPSSEEKEEQPQQSQQPSESADPIAEAVQTTQQKEKPRGIITEIGEWMQDNLDPLNVVDRQLEANAELTKSIPIVGNVNRAVADFVPNREESRKIIADIPVVGKPAVAIGSGVDAGAALLGPTLIANVTNQEATWDNRPSVLTDDDWFSDIIYDSVKLITPLLLSRGIGGGTLLAGTGIESAMETLSQDGADDLILGRQIAGIYGRIWGGITGDPQKGADFTKALIEGDDASIQPFLKTWSFLNNYAVNSYAGKLIEVGGPLFRRVINKVADKAGNLEVISKLTGKSVDETADDMVNMPEPAFRPDQEPASAIRPENTALVPSPGNAVNEPALLNRLISETQGVPLDLDDPSNFFFDWGKLSSTDEGVIALRNAFKGKVPLEPGSIAQARILKNTAEFLVDTKGLLNTDQEAFLMQLADRGGLIENNPNLRGPGANRYSTKNLEALKDFTDYFEKYMRIDLNTEEGLAAIATSRYLAEQAGQNLARVADQIMLLKDKGLPYDDLVNNVLIPNNKFIRAALSPFRYAKRQWALGGNVQQYKFYEQLSGLLGEAPVERKSSELIDPKTANAKPSLTVDGEKVKIKINGEDFEIDTLEQIWGLVGQEGVEGAREIFELAMQNIRFGDPDKVLTNLNLVSNVVKEALRQKKGFERYFYNIVALGQLSTQTNAVGATVFRQALEPLALVGAGLNPLNRNVAVKESMYGVGMWVGGLYHFGSAFRSGLRAMNTNAPVRGKDRFTDSYSSSLRKELGEIRRLHVEERLMDQKANMDPFRYASRELGRLLREVAYMPKFNAATRLLMAGDEAASVTTAGQHAWGRAFVNLMERREFNPRQMMAQIKLEESKIFKGPAWKNEIIDAEVAADAERVTLQRSFEIGPDSNIFERYFAAQAKANELSIINRVFNAFPRPAYRQIEQEIVENVIGSLPGGINLNKRLKKIYAQKDPTQRLGIESQKSLAHAVTFAGIGAAILSQVQNENLPEITFSDNKLMVDGIDYDIAIDLDKFSPATIYTALISNILDGFYNGTTSEQGLTDKLTYVVQATLADIVDRNLLQGQQQFSRTFDVDSSNWANNAFGWAWNFITPGIIREIANVVQPYETVQDVRTNKLTEIGSTAARLAFNNIQNPPIWDIYSPRKTANPKPKVPSSNPGDPNAVRQSVLSSLFYPGNVKPVRFNDPVARMLVKFDFEAKNDYIRNFQGIELNAAEQSLLTREIQGPLYQKLAEYEQGQYKKDLKAYKKKVQQLGADSAVSKAAMQKIRNKLTRIHRDVKNNAIENSELYNVDRIREAFEQMEMDRSQDAAMQPINPSNKGLYATAANQSTQLASQVREILDLPT
jgi:hypothetical protein